MISVAPSFCQAWDWHCQSANSSQIPVSCLSYIIVHRPISVEIVGSALPFHIRRCEHMMQCHSLDQCLVLHRLRGSAYTHAYTTSTETHSSRIVYFKPSCIGSLVRRFCKVLGRSLEVVRYMPTDGVSQTGR